LLLLFLGACSNIEKPKPQPFYAETAPPQKKEFRWSNGKLPKSFDPAFAAAPPETDVVRAIYEGLTDTNARTLKTVPAIAVDWSTSDDYRTWIFKLRRDAKWSNGERINAADFVRSWTRLAALGERIPNFQLLSNIAGMPTAETQNNSLRPQEETEISETKSLNQSSAPISKPNADTAQNPEIRLQTEPKALETVKNSPAETSREEKPERKTKPQKKNETTLGVEAVDDFTLRVSLVKPDKDFPALVAHPLFRPVYADGKYFETGKINADIITSGAFHVANIASDGVTLDRAENFWNKSQVQLERVRFVPTENAEKALEAYRAGEIDAITNVDFEPLALKLLTPFDDFQRTTHSALNFYEFNRSKPPFDDHRVREALTIAIERQRLTEDEMDGASLPAYSFSPFENETNLKLSQNTERAKNLLISAGFRDGENFPVIRLVVNRNNVQQRIARAVAKMWKQNLNVATEILVREQDELEAARAAGDFDVLRRGVLLPTTDETANMLAIFNGKIQLVETTNDEKNPSSDTNTINDGKKSDAANPQTNASLSQNTDVEPTANESATSVNREFLTENQAMMELPAIPLYFSTSYSLVKPYVQGFETNSLDAPSLKEVRIDNEWQPKKAKGES
jgi:ABC-type oligopeptide transport system substrate-binding subunit